MTSLQRIPAQVLVDFVRAVFERLGAMPPQAATVADILVAASLRGVDSHGVALLDWYVALLRSGKINFAAEATVVQDNSTMAVFDAHNGLGMPASVAAMDRCLDMAAQHGTASVTVRNSNHFGMAGYYAMRALPRDMIGIATTNASRLIAPTFGVEPMLGTNPIAVAVPAGQELPYVLDMATSVRPFGKMMIAKFKGEELPVGVAIGADGEPVHDPETFIQRVRNDFSAGLLPLGSFPELANYKGYGLAMLVDILSGVLSGANFSKHVVEHPHAPSNIGHWFMAIKIENFMPVDTFKARMDTLITELKAARKAPGADRIYVPGEIEFETEAERREHGIPLSPAVVGQLQAIGEQAGVALDVPRVAPTDSMG